MADLSRGDGQTLEVPTERLSPSLWSLSCMARLLFVPLLAIVLVVLELSCMARLTFVPLLAFLEMQNPQVDAFCLIVLAVLENTSLNVVDTAFAVLELRCLQLQAQTCTSWCKLQGYALWCLRYEANHFSEVVLVTCECVCSS
jgi:hypothetical protein